MTQTVAKHVDVLIVGGGPAGLATAEHLAPSQSVLVVHQDREIGFPVRTSGGTWVKDMEALGIPTPLYRTMDEVHFSSDNADVICPMPTHRTAIIDITGTYRWLAQRAVAAGATVVTGTKFIDATRTSDGFNVKLRQGKDTLDLHARHIVDASGHACAVVNALGLATKPPRVGVGYEEEYEIISAPDRRAVLIVGEQVQTGYGWIFPAPNNHIRIGMGIMQPDTDTSPREIYDTLVTPAFLEKFGLKLGPKIQTNAGTIPAYAYDPTLVYDGVTRVGDSANMATPTVGEGIRIAIEQGRILGDELGAYLQGTDPQALKRYERNARRMFSRNYFVGYAANRRMSAYSTRSWDRGVHRVARLSEEELAGLIRSEFSPRMIAKAALKQILHKFSRRSKAS